MSLLPVPLVRPSSIKEASSLTVETAKAPWDRLIQNTSIWISFEGSENNVFCPNPPTKGTHMAFLMLNVETAKLRLGIA
jgi:hypothetical protein